LPLQFAGCILVLVFLVYPVKKISEKVMKIGSSLIQVSIKRPKLVTAIMVLVTLILGLMIVNVKVDTDPENMLSEDEAVRVFHTHMKKE
jgi:hypothetical protein